MFDGVGGRDVYNITAPFINRHQEVIIGRVEERNSELSQVCFFSRTGQIWRPIAHLPAYDLQDPFIVKINQQFIFGGIEVITSPSNPNKIISWVTQFYRGADLESLQHFATGPIAMKDIRLVELQDGKVGVFTRPQGKKGGRGQIGFTILDKLEQLNAEILSHAEILSQQFVRSEWGGANEAHVLSNGKIGVLGHIACFGKHKSKHYYSMVFWLNPQTREKSPLKMIAERSDFPNGPGKRPGLVDVIFSGGIIRLGNGRAELSVGVSDAEAYRIMIPDPFIEYEQEQ